MQAAVFHGHRDLRVEALPDPTPPEGWSVVEVARSSICHSDLKEYDGPYYIMRHGRPNPLTGISLPVVLGHEFSGRVVESNGVLPGGLAVGDRVAPEPCIVDGTCWYCRHGRYNLCDNLAILGFDAHGSFAQYVAVPNYALHRVPDDLSDEAAAFVEPFAVALHGVRRGRVMLGDVVVIAGAGMIGLCAILAAEAAGASKVFVTEPSRERMSRARELGAIPLDITDGDEASQLLDMTSGHGADVAIDCVGLESSLNSALAMARRGGRVVVVGTFPERPRVDLDRIGLEEREVIGSLIYADDFPRAITAISNASVDMTVFITDRIPLREIAAAGFERSPEMAMRTIRVMVDVHDA